MPTYKEYLQVQTEGKRSIRRAVKHYRLEMILAVGYRVRSQRGTLFRQWATLRLEELLRKGFTMDDDRIKSGQTAGIHYFDELLERIRDIRASERMFYQKIVDIYSTSMDYDPKSEQKAHQEFDRFDENRRLEADRTPSDFDKFVKQTILKPKIQRKKNNDKC